MNLYSENISSWLNDDSLLETSKSTLVSNPTQSHAVSNVQVSLEDTVMLVEYLRNILLQAIESEVFFELPIPTQLNINNQVQALHQNRNNIAQVITNTQNLYHQILITGIEGKQKSYDRFKKALSDISDLRRKYNGTLKSLSTLKEKVDEFNTNFDSSRELLSQIENYKLESEKSLDEIKSHMQNTEDVIEQISQNEQDIENSKKEVVAFKVNVDSYKNDINKNSELANKIVLEFESKRKNVEKLISDSEKALGLKSTEGISAALSSQYDTENSKGKRVQWIWTAIVFVAIAFFGVILLIYNIEIFGYEANNESVNAIIARIVFIAIAIGGATFAAKQFLRQKNLADRYAYKLVLAKSIVAFAQEIKQHDSTKAAEYLEKVLDEINKSPLDSSKEVDDVVTPKNLDALEKISKIFKAD